MLNKIKREISLIAFIVQIVLNLFLIGFPIYSIAVGNGIIAINIILLLLALGTMAFFLMTASNKERKFKSIKKKYERISKAIALACRAVPLVTTIYGAIIASGKTDTLTILVIVATAIIWVIQLLFELIKYFIETRVNLFVDGLKLDLKKPLTLIKKISRSKDNEDWNVVSEKKS